MKKVINVTERDIKRAKNLIGSQPSSVCCPIALAVRRVFRKPYRVGLGDIIRDRDFIELPREARTFISRFDDGLPVKPIRFEVEA